jgi:hypothetical protein
MTPQQPTAAIDEDVRGEFGTFSLIDPDADYWQTEPDFTDDPIVTAGPHRVWFYSAATDHYARVRLELWTTPPPEPTHDEAATRSVSFDTNGRRLCLATTVNGPVIHHPTRDRPGDSPRIQHLEPPSPGHYTVEVMVTGRTEAAELPEASTRRGVENWLIRLWPTTKPEQLWWSISGVVLV